MREEKPVKNDRVMRWTALVPLVLVAVAMFTQWS